MLRAIQLPANGFAPSLESAAAFPGDSGIQVQSDVDALRVLLLKSFAVTNSVLYEIGIELLPIAARGANGSFGPDLGPMSMAVPKATFRSATASHCDGKSR